MSMGRYDDIMGLPRPVSRRHPRMPIPQRAKQFMPFAALKGYGDAIAEKGVLYDSRGLLSDEDRAIVDAALRALSEALRRGERPRVGLEYFEPKPGKDGDRGFCRTLEGTLEKLTPELRTLRVDGRTFDFGEITDIWRVDEHGG